MACILPANVIAKIIRTQEILKIVVMDLAAQKVSPLSDTFVD